MSTHLVSRIALVTGTLTALLLAACGSTGANSGMPADPYAPPATSDTGESAATDALSLGVAETDLGEIVVDGAGMTLYMFTPDSPNTSTCEGQCLRLWPPLAGEPAAGTGIDEALLGSFVRSDGTTQASYNDWPLYYWVGDKNPGDISGQGVDGAWYVLGPNGEPIR